MEHKNNNIINLKAAANIGRSKEENLHLTRAAFYDRASKNAEYMEDEFFGSMFGITFRTGKEEFFTLMKSLADIWSEGSGIVFDFPNDSYEGQTKTKYTYREMEELLSECGFRIYEHLDYKQAEEDLLYSYNISHARKQIKPPKGVDYCLAVRKW